MNTRNLILAGVIAVILVAAVTWKPAPTSDDKAPINVTTGLTGTGSPLALHGYDPVAYFEAGEPQRGDATYSAVHEGATYRFANEANESAFEDDPDGYVPRFGGYCAYGASVGKKFDGDPLVWKIVDDRLYLNLNPQIKAKWIEDVPGNIAAANEHWTEIEGKAPGEL
jgi:YHS domain-containing protein